MRGGERNYGGFDVGEAEVDAGNDEDDDADDSNGGGELQSIHVLDGAEREQNEERDEQRDDLRVSKRERSNRLVLGHEIANAEQLTADSDDLREQHVHVSDIDTEIK